jgi:hypothetical protein
MSWRATLSTFSRSRRLLQTLERIAVAQESQAASLLRIADGVAPQFAAPAPEELITSTGLSFARDTEQILVQEYCERVRADTGHEPTEDEILAYLTELETRH